RIDDVPWVDIVEAQLRTFARGGAYPFLPWVDGKVVAEGSGAQAAADGNGAEVPLLLGTTRDEYSFVRPMDEAAATLDERGLFARLASIPGADVGGRPWGQVVAERYREVRMRRREPVSPGDLYYAIETDRAMRLGPIRFVEARCCAGSSTYVYLFDWESPNPLLGSSHMIELPFVFGTLDLYGMD